MPHEKAEIDSNNRMRAWAIVVVSCLGFQLSSFYRVSATIIAPQLSQDLGLSSPDLGIVSAAFFYAFGAAQIPLGMTLDRTGTRIPVAVLMFLGAAGSIVFALSGSMAQAVLGRILLGVGMSAAMMGPFNLLASWFPPQRFAYVAGLMVSVGLLGQMLAATPLALMAQSLGWRNSFLVVAAYNFLQATAFLLVVRDRPPGVPKPQSPPFSPFKGLLWLLLRPSFWAISLTGLFRYGTLMSLMGLWAGPFMMNALGYSQIETGNALLSLSLGFVLSPMVLGRISDNWLRSHKKTVLPTIPLSIFMILSLSLWPRGFNQFWAWLILFFLGFSTGAMTLFYAQIKDLNPAHVRATAFTGVNLFVMIGPAFIIQATGFLVPGDPAGMADPAGFANAWYFMAGGIALSGLLYLFCPEGRSGSET